MILGDAQRAAVNRTTLDDLFRRATMRGPEALALADPPNTAAITGCRPRPLTHAEADGAISALAARLHALGLPTDSVVAVQLANTVDSVIAMLPHRCRCSGALLRCSAKAIITAARIGTSAPAENAMQAASEVFAIRHLCGFGPDLPDGVLPLDDCVRAGVAFQLLTRPGNADAHVPMRGSASVSRAACRPGVNALIVGALQQRHPS